LLAAALLVVGSSGCLGVFADDGSSVSLGSNGSGALLRGVELPESGAGYEVPPAWRERHRSFATDEVVRWLTGALGRMARDVPGSVAQVGDLSALGGGRSLTHKSHGSGRDVDIFFFAADDAGNPVRSERAAFRFSASGEAVAWSPPDPIAPVALVRGRRPICRRPVKIDEPIPGAHFDARRNWALVRELLSDPAVEVQWIFIHRALAEILLRQGPTAADDPALVARAAALMHQPSDAQAHDDHMHVRVYCEPTDRTLGCQDRGPQRWWKKRWKDLARGGGGPPEPAAGATTWPEAPYAAVAAGPAQGIPSGR
jgi:penicillin-insensitive murein endopeptidase